MTTRCILGGTGANCLVDTAFGFAGAACAFERTVVWRMCGFVGVLGWALGWLCTAGGFSGSAITGQEALGFCADALLNAPGTMSAARSEIVAKWRFMLSSLPCGFLAALKAA